MLYDHITFHTTDRPDLSNQAAARHMGHYYTWAVSQNLHSAAAAMLPLFTDLQNEKILGSDFVLKQLNGGIDAACFNELGQRFTEFYYTDEDEGYGRFLEDYFLALGLENEEQFYRYRSTPQDQNILNQNFQAAFEQWQSSLKNT